MFAPTVSVKDHRRLGFVQRRANNTANANANDNDNTDPNALPADARKYNSQ